MNLKKKSSSNIFFIFNTSTDSSTVDKVRTRLILRRKQIEKVFIYK